MTAFIATDKQRTMAETLSGYGVPQDDIARLIGCSAPTLRKHFADELALGSAKATAKIAQTLFAKAAAGDTVSMLFWMKCRAGWREVQQHDVNLRAVPAASAGDADLEAIAFGGRLALAASQKSEEGLDELGG